MTTQGPSPLPPTIIQHSRPISQSDANDFLSAYLDRSTSDPSLQPNAVLSEHGPISRNTTAAPSLVLHNLKRVQAGLAGEVLGKDFALESFKDDGGDDGRKAGGNWFEEEINAYHGWEGKGRRKSGGEGGGGAEWQDRKRFEVEQQVEEGRGDDEVDAGVVHEDIGEQVELREDGMPVIDKEERKRKKKEKRKEEKRAKVTKG